MERAPGERPDGNRRSGRSIANREREVSRRAVLRFPGHRPLGKQGKREEDKQEKGRGPSFLLLHPFVLRWFIRV